MVCKIKEQFDGFVAAGCGSAITLEQVNKWFTEANLLGAKLTAEEIKTAFDKIKSKSLNHDQFMRFLEDLAESKGMSSTDLEDQLGTVKLTDLFKGEAPAGEKKSCKKAK